MAVLIYEGLRIMVARGGREGMDQGSLNQKGTQGKQEHDAAENSEHCRGTTRGQMGESKHFQNSCRRWGKHTRLYPQNKSWNPPTN
jgi:hypothetical protein